jgi:hypothetical protein
MGTYLVYGLNHADPMTNGQPSVVKIKESDSIDWSFSYTLSGSHDAIMKISSNGWGDQGLLVVVERLKCD